MSLNSSKGYTDILFLFLAALFGFLIAGGFTIFHKAKQLNTSSNLVSTAPLGPHSSLQLGTLNITVIPLPTLPPTDTPSVNIPPTATPTPGNTAINPPGNCPIIPPTNKSLICGTNLGLFNDVDWVSNPGAQAALAQLHIPTVRIPWRADVGQPDPTGARLLQSVRIAHSLGVIPLINLPSETKFINQDISIIQQLNTIMCGSQIFYELGNEKFDDTYLGKWNAIIPSLKPIAVNAWFGGPVAGANDSDTNGITIPGTTRMAQFYVNASPRPDFLDWHEYTCGNVTGLYNVDPKFTAQYCFDRIANTPLHNWGQHVQDTKTALLAVGITTMPKIFITEWGYSSAPAGANTPDPRLATLTAMHFPSEALKTLKNIGVYAAYQYVLDTNRDVNLINYNGSQITPYGQDFQAFCSTQ